jgi:hypothetical protein
MGNVSGVRTILDDPTIMPVHELLHVKQIYDGKLPKHDSALVKALDSLAGLCI